MPDVVSYEPQVGNTEISLHEFLGYARMGWAIRYRIHKSALILHAAGLYRLFRCTVRGLTPDQVSDTLNAIKINGARFLEEGEWTEGEIRSASRLVTSGIP